MEILGVLVPLVECLSPHIAKRWEYHRDLNKNREALREILDKLKCRKRNIETKLDLKVVPRETEVGEEVKDWLDRAEKICQEFEDIEREVGDVKFFSRASLGRKIVEKKVKVDELYQEGVFSEDELVKRLQQRGNVMPIVATVEGDTTFRKKWKEIWSCLLDDKIKKIGVYGMGGVGKTTALEHINNRLLQEKDMFDKVMWVTVSNDSTVRALQDKIAHKLELDISKVDDEEIRAEELRKGFIKSKRYVLILDDLWKVEHDTLKKVGIPDPAPISGCKLVLTTRSLSVCRMINCDSNIEMNPLSEKEALDLFIEKVGRDVSSNPKLEKLVEQVARECARLPLAIVVIAGSLRNKTDPNEWEVALAELKDATASISSEVTKNLRLSYDWLKNKKYQDCLLYCALYPEDYPIERNLLIDQLIAAGVVEDIKTRQYQIGKAHVMLNELVSVCLLNDMVNEEEEACVKLHDLIRDMAIQIMHENPSRYLVRMSGEWEPIPNEEIWNVDIEKVSLIGHIIVPSSTKPPMCPRISTLFLNINALGEVVIPNDFFLHMKRLNVLDLSNTMITNLPESVSDLVNLSVLLLRKCTKLIHVPSLAKLSNMRRLDLYSTRITELPKGVEMLINLTYLNLSETKLKLIPDGVFCKLMNLQYLSFIPSFKPTLTAEELSNLRKLETFEAALDLKSFNAFLRSVEKGDGGLTNLRFIVVPEVMNLYVPTRQKQVFLHNCNIRCDSVVGESGGFPLLIPKNIEALHFHHCKFNASSSLCLFTPFEHATILMEIHISDCDGIEHLFQCSPIIFPLLQRLVRLDLSYLRDLRGLVNMERASSPLPFGSFSSLKKLHLIFCDEVQKIFILSDPLFPNLEEIKILFCRKLEDIISRTSFENDQEGEEEASESVHRASANTISLPKLRWILLKDLPKLNSIPFIADSLQGIQVINCPKIKEIPLLDREPYPSSLQYIDIDTETWQSLEWDHPSAKDAIEKTEEWARACERALSRDIDSMRIRTMSAYQTLKRRALAKEGDDHAIASTESNDLADEDN